MDKKREGENLLLFQAPSCKGETFLLQRIQISHLHPPSVKKSLKTYKKKLLYTSGYLLPLQVRRFSSLVVFCPSQVVEKVT